MLLIDARQIARQVLERDDRNVETVAEADKARGLVRRVAVEHAGHHQRLVGDEADSLARDAAEADDDVGSEQLHHLEELALVDQRLDHVAHIVGHGRIARNDRSDVVLRQRSRRSDLLGLGRIVHRNHRDQLAYLHEALVLALGEEMRVAGHLAVYPGAAQLLHRDLLAEHGLDHFGPRDEHLRYVLDDEHEVGQGGRIDGSAGAGTQNHRNLRDHAARKRIAEENLAVARQRVDPFLNAGSARVVDSDQRNAHVQRIIHDLGDFTGVHKAERTAGYGKVLCKDGNRRTQNGSGTDNHAVAGK